MSKLHDIATEEQQKQQDKELRRIYNLSQRDYWLAILLGFIFPIGGYLYTRRGKAFALFFLSLTLIAMFIPEDPDEDFFSPSMPLMIIAGAVAAADNANAIRWAREQVAAQKPPRS
ncbi:MAG: hypothetical protein HC924_17540 [Synechococcaceae cyanobacterium SM2_3_2]|nr:hypothetical protein [Synechococcaceae cyanobacterium SM2_3_2]